jgi:drug/metabolite transporter (DMT)-like permease
VALSDTARGTLFMCTAMAAFSLGDAVMKRITMEVPLMQAIALRGMLSVLALALIAWLAGALSFRMERTDARLLGLRSLAEVGATLTFFAALLHMELANLSAILQSLPLAVTLAAALFLAEPVGWRRLAAIGVGFLGVLCIIRPGTTAFDQWSLMGLASVALVVVRDLATRRMTTRLPSVTVALCAGLGVTLTGIGGVVAQGGFVPVAPQNLALLCLAASTLILGYLTIVKAMRVGDIASVAPFRYTALLWAILLGWLFFGTLPDAATWIGAALIVGSGLFTLAREARLRRVRAVGAPP